MSKIFGYGASSDEIYGCKYSRVPETRSCDYGVPCQKSGTYKQPRLGCNDPREQAAQSAKSPGCAFALPLQFDGLYPVQGHCMTGIRPVADRFYQSN